MCVCIYKLIFMQTVANSVSIETEIGLNETSRILEVKRNERQSIEVTGI